MILDKKAKYSSSYSSTSKTFSLVNPKISKEEDNFENSLLSKIKVRIIDFNVSRCKNTKIYYAFDKDSKRNIIMYSIAGTPFFSAPELLECLSCYTEQVDIWSVGCLLFYMIQTQLPYKGLK